MRFFEFQSAKQPGPKFTCQQKVDNLFIETKSLRSAVSQLKNIGIDPGKRQEICNGINNMIRVIRSTLKDINQNCPDFINDPKVESSRSLSDWLEQESKRFCGK
jgi:hypothetical protein